MRKKNVSKDKQKAENVKPAIPGPQRTISEFEKALIQECREDGMPDEEIMAWLKEI